MTERDKKLFVKNLKGEPVGTDIFGRDIFEGDYLIYAVSWNSSAEMKVGKIIAVLNGKLKILGAAKSQWLKGPGWQLMDKPSYFHRTKEAACLWDNPLPEVVALFESPDPKDNDQDK